MGSPRPTGLDLITMLSSDVEKAINDKDLTTLQNLSQKTFLSELKTSKGLTMSEHAIQLDAHQCLGILLQDAEQGVLDKNLRLAVLAGAQKCVKFLLSKGANCNQFDEKTEYNALHMAIIKGNAAITELLLEAKPYLSIDTRDSIPRTPLDLAIVNDHFDVFALLLKYHAPIDLLNTVPRVEDIPRWRYIFELLKKNKSDEANTLGKVLLFAARGSNDTTHRQECITEVLRQLKSKTPKEITHGRVLDIREPNTGLRIIHRAAANGHIQILKQLFEWGAKPSDLPKPPHPPITPLQLAIEGGHAKVVRLLLDNKADCNATFLELAATLGKWDCVEELLNGPTFEITVLNKILDLAATSERTVCAKKLRELGATTDRLTKKEAELFNIIKDKTPQDLANYLQKKSVSQQIKNDAKLTPLEYAATMRRWDQIPTLLNEAKPGTYSEAILNNVLRLAVKDNQPYCVELLLKYAKPTLSLIPLELAIFKNYPEVFKVLLTYFADKLYVQNDEGSKPIMYAAEIQRWDYVLQFLNANHYDTNALVKLLYIASQQPKNPDLQKCIKEILARIKSKPHEEILNARIACASIITTGRFTIHGAAANGHMEILQQWNDDPSRPTKPVTSYPYRASPLQLAIEGGQVEAAIFLIGRGANCYFRIEPHNLTLIEHAANLEQWECVELLKNKFNSLILKKVLTKALLKQHDCANRLWEELKKRKDFDINSVADEKSGYSLLYAATANQSTQLVHSLLQSKADPTHVLTLPNRAPTTALQLAEALNNPAITGYLKHAVSAKNTLIADAFEGINSFFTAYNKVSALLETKECKNDYNFILKSMESLEDQKTFLLVKMALLVHYLNTHYLNPHQILRIDTKIFSKETISEDVHHYIAKAYLSLINSSFETKIPNEIGRICIRKIISLPFKSADIEKTSELHTDRLEELKAVEREKFQKLRLKQTTANLLQLAAIHCLQDIAFKGKLDEKYHINPELLRRDLETSFEKSTINPLKGVLDSTLDICSKLKSEPVYPVGIAVPRPPALNPSVIPVNDSPTRSYVYTPAPAENLAASYIHPPAENLPTSYIHAPAASFVPPTTQEIQAQDPPPARVQVASVVVPKRPSVTSVSFIKALPHQNGVKKQEVKREKLALSCS